MTSLAALHRFDATADPDGGYVIAFPDLPGCITQVESIDEVGPAAREIHDLWIAAARENGTPIPPATSPDQYSGKFLLRVPKSLHRRLAERARQEGVSLNQLTLSILAESIGASTSSTQHPSTRQDQRNAFVAEPTEGYDSSSGR